MLDSKPGTATPREYRHTQIGWAPIFIFGAAAFVLWGIAVLSEAPWILRPFFVVAAALVTVGGILGAAMTVDVGQAGMTIKLGGGVLTRRVEFADIDQLTVQPLAWYQLRRGPVALDGLGHIKILRVGGKYAVALRSKGRLLVLGTNDPSGLRAAIVAHTGNLPAAAEPVTF